MMDDFLVVAIGASAGGLEACRKLLTAMPARSGTAFIVVQHLDPNHPSLMVDLLASHTDMPVQQATEGMPIKRDHLYVIPPGTELSVVGGALHVTRPGRPHGMRLPFDALVNSLAGEFGKRVVVVLLSGTGADGSTALQTVKAEVGLVIAQDPAEAAFDGMPRSAVAAGVVDLVLPVAEIPHAILDYDKRRAPTAPAGVGDTLSSVEARMPEIIEVLRQRTPHDFSGYKPSSLLRRIERRMAAVTGCENDVDGYLARLMSEPSELEHLANYIFVNVTRFFRDGDVFELLANTVIPDIVAHRVADQTLRIWVAGCSTGEEAYSLVMLILEHTTRSGSPFQFQVFASDADAEAIAFAREGYYPESISADISPERLARFFIREKQGYRVSSELRGAVIFACQDLLVDPPFSRLDMVSCRNLLIYLGHDAQTRVIDVFHFALREGGILLLGNAETIGATDDRFESILDSSRIYRHVAQCRPGEVRFAIGTEDGARGQPRALLPGKPRMRPLELAELCRRMVIENFAPAAVLINHRHECLYSVGPVERFLRVAPGHPTLDLLDMAPQPMRTRLRLVIAQATDTRSRAQVSRLRISQEDGDIEFAIEVIPGPDDTEKLMLVCFKEVAKHSNRPPLGDGETPANPTDLPRVAALEIEIEATRSELRHTIFDLEQSREEQRAISEEASSVAEEYQSTNEELLTSKEELQSLNEELTALNGQLQETLDRQKTTSDYLQNILNSTDIATIFLDGKLRIRFFTPATKQLFSVIPSDIGRPLGDLSSLSADSAALDDARTVLETLVPMDREIEMPDGVWFMRRIQPYRTHNNGIEGVVITFDDISQRKITAAALQAAKEQAQAANAAKSRFLAVASHDLRQPLQSLVLIQGLLAKQVTGDKPKRLLDRLDETLSAMAGMLNTLLDINQIEIGAVEPVVVNSPINSLLVQMRDEFTYHAHARGLQLRIVESSLTVTTDPRLLEQVLRNLLSNAIKYTEKGKVVLGCRRRAGVVSVEVWDSGIGIPKTEIKSIFDEYYQIGNAARQRSQGLGLGLSIVQRLAHLLKHRIDVRSMPGRGSGFAIEIQHKPDQPASIGHIHIVADELGEPEPSHRRALILIVEDDPEVGDLLEDFLVNEGHQALIATGGPAAELLMSRTALQPDLLITDYNLPGGMNGLELAERVRSRLDPAFPIIVLTGDISSATLRNIGQSRCVHVNKPVKIDDLSAMIQRLLRRDQASKVLVEGGEPVVPLPSGPSMVYVVDDDRHVRDQVREVLEDGGMTVADFATAEAFLAAFKPGGSEACLLIDAYLPGMSGVDALMQLRQARHRLPTIMMTGFGDVGIAVDAMKSGAIDFIEKPVARGELLGAISRALGMSRDRNKLEAWQAAAASQLADLTSRQRQIMDLVLAGHPSKNIAADLGISQRTVENHRAAIMERTGAKSLPELARIAVAANLGDAADGVVK